MNNTDFTAIVQETIARCTDTLTAKNDEYSAGKDRLHAFRSAAALTGQTMRAALAGMMLKHTVSVYDMCRDDKPHSLDTWNEKIGDHINYLLLLRAVVEEESDGSCDRLHLEEADRAIGYMDELIKFSQEELDRYGKEHN